MPEIPRIAISSSSVVCFYEKRKALITQIKKQGGNWEKLIKQFLKTYENHPLVFQKYDISNKDILRMFCRHFFRI